MIIKEKFRDATATQGELCRHYSDQGYKMLQVETGLIYDDAIDVEPCRYTYEETDQLICPPPKEPEENDEISDSRALDIILGGE